MENRYSIIFVILFFYVDLLNWVIANLSGEFANNEFNVPKFVVLCWILWKNRTCFIFQQITSSPKEIIGRVDCFVANIRVAMKKGDLVNGRCEEGFKWSSPSHGWVKINTNGSKSMTNNWSIVGGVIQDSLGN